jgi:thiol-disulfide isomerase/thioredoxin
VKTILISALSIVLVLCARATAAEPAADFPPGMFTDGGSYRLDDFKGKVLVLFFYEQQCPSCRASIPKRNELVEKYKDKPVKFIAVAAGDSLVEAKTYQRETKLAMPTFADSLSLMENSYGLKISLNNIYQMRAIGPDGQVVRLGLMGEGLDRVVDQAKWKYKSDDYHAKLAGAVDLLEWNQFEAGMKLVSPLRKNSNKELAASAEKLYDVVKAEAEEWKSEADGLLESDPARAGDLYARIAACFPGEDLAKSANDAAKKLQASKAYKDETAARRMFAQLRQGASQARASQKTEVAKFADSIAKKYPDTPTGRRAGEIAKLLGQ